MTRKAKPKVVSEPVTPLTPARDGVRPVAVIDIGATAIRLRIAEIDPDGAVRSLESLQHAVHLGKDTFTSGSIQRATVEQCLKILKGFRRIMEEYGVTGDDQIRAVATSAVREAENRDSFLDRIYMSTRINVEAIEGAEENSLTYIAVQDALRGVAEWKTGDVLIADLGGGSTELLLLKDGRVTFASSYRLGSLRLRETLETYSAPADRVRNIIDQHLRRSMDQLHRSVPVKKVQQLVAVSGDVQFAASLLSPTWAEARMNYLDLKSLSALADKISTMPVDELVRQYQIPYQETETVGAALLGYVQLARVFQVNSILAPKCSLRDGLLKEIATHGTWTEEFTSQAIHAAITLGDKYQSDEKHAQQVADLSVRLFRELQSEHKLDQRFELLLRIAALLHEIGGFVSDRSHHKHSMYLILNSDLFGLTNEDIMLIALVARYHRRAMPRPYHEEYNQLDRDSRLAVSKLAAILRVADALDRNHVQQVRDVSFAREKGQFVITVGDVQDLTIERLALKEKGNMFEEIFAMPIVLRGRRAGREAAAHG